MKTLNDKNYNTSGFKEAEELDSLIYAFQRDKYRDIKWEEFNQSEDDSIKNFGDFLEKDPLIIVTAYNHNDDITLIISENSWKLTVNYDDMIIEDDIKKIIKELKLR